MSQDVEGLNPLTQRAIAAGGQWIIDQLKNTENREKFITELCNPIDAEIEKRLWKFLAKDVQGFANAEVAALYDLMVSVIEKLIQEKLGTTEQGEKQ